MGKDGLTKEIKATLSWGPQSVVYSLADVGG